jgi:coenzyme F420-0:L-glutamate ligase/coenzyme F420-1:gamma-L-glutamate ligase
MSASAMSASARLELIAVPGLPEVRPGDDLAALLVSALDRAGLDLRDGDVLAVSSKVVAKAEGRFAADRDAAVAAETLRVVAERLTGHGLARIVASRSGPVLAAAGVDASNLPDGAGGPALMLPADPDASARRLRAALAARARVGVIVTDTLGRPWRIGQVDTAIGAAGVVVGQDLAGLPDAHGRRMEVTHRALADEIAAAADLVKGKVDGVPVALVRGLAALVTDADGDGAASLLRRRGEDWFRYGHAEAARAALGVSPGHPGVPAQPVTGGTAAERLGRAVTVALAAPPIITGSTERAGSSPESAVSAHRVDLTVTIPVPPRASPAAWAEAGALAQRIAVAAWAEDLPVAVSLDPDGATIVVAPAGVG